LLVQGGIGGESRWVGRRNDVGTGKVRGLLEMVALFGVVVVLVGIVVVCFRMSGSGKGSVMGGVVTNVEMGIGMRG